MPFNWTIPPFAFSTQSKMLNKHWFMPIEITLQTGARCDNGELMYLITVLVVSRICSDK